MEVVVIPEMFHHYNFGILTGIYEDNNCLFSTPKLNNLLHFQP